MVVVGRAVAAVGGDVEQVRALDQAQVLQHEGDLTRPFQPPRLEVLDVRVGPIHGDAVRVEHADPEHEVFDGPGRGDGQGHGEALARHVDVALVPAVVQEPDGRDLDLAAAPAALAVALGGGGLAGGIGGGGLAAPAAGCP